jgi:hypothetical protein
LEKCFDALIKHTGKEPVAFHTHCLVNLPQDLSEELSDEPLLKGQKKQLERLRRKIQPKSYRYLLNYFLKTTRRIIPDASERESLFDEAIGKFATHLLSMPPHKRIGEYKNVEPAVKCDLKDWSKNQRRKKRHSKGDVVSLNEDEKNENGKIDPALQTQPDLSFITWESILAACEDEYERQIIEFRVEGYTEKEIGEKLGKSQPYVNKKIRKIFEKWKKVE